MPPVNTSFLTASSLGALPAATVQNDINDAGVNFTVYWKFTAPANCVTVALCGYSGKIAPGYRPTATLWIGPAAAPTQIFAVAAQNKPMQMPVTPGSEYFIKFEKNVDTAGPESLTINVLPGFTASPQTGDILINDDGLGGDGFALAILSETDYTIRGYVAGIAEGEAGDILPTGQMFFENHHDDTGIVYSPSFGVLSTVNPFGVGANRPRIRANRATNKFWASHFGVPAEVFYMTAAGVQGPVHNVIGTVHTACCAALDESIWYYVLGLATNQLISRWDLVNDLAMADLAGTNGGGTTTSVDMLMLADGTFVIVYEEFAPYTPFIRRYTTAGVLLNTYTAPAPNLQPNSSFARLAYALDDPIHFWLMSHPVAGEMYHYKIRISDGAVVETRKNYSYTMGVFTGGENVAAVLGASVSCPFMIYLTDPGGIFKIVPDKRTDHDGNTTVSIPNPTFKSALLP